MSNCIKFYWQSQGVLKQIQKVSSSAWQITGSFKLRLVRAQTQLKLSSSAEIHSISNTVPRGQFHKSWTAQIIEIALSIYALCLRPTSEKLFTGVNVQSMVQNSVCNRPQAVAICTKYYKSITDEFIVTSWLCFECLLKLCYFDKLK